MIPNTTLQNFLVVMKVLTVHLPHDPAIPFLSNPREIKKYVLWLLNPCINNTAY